MERPISGRRDSPLRKVRNRKSQSEKVPPLVSSPDIMVSILSPDKSMLSERPVLNRFRYIPIIRGALTAPGDYKSLYIIGTSSGSFLGRYYNMSVL